MGGRPGPLPESSSMWNGPEVMLPGVPAGAPRIVGVASPLPLLPPACP